jgi:hypothetical protein
VRVDDFSMRWSSTIGDKGRRSLVMMCTYAQSGVVVERVEEDRREYRR